MEFKGFKYPMPNVADINAVTVMTPRLKKLKNDWQEAKPQISVDDTLLFTESRKETDASAPPQSLSAAATRCAP